MWPVFVFVWLAFLAIIAIVTQQAFGYDVTHLPAHFQALPLPQRIATGTIAAMAIALIVTSIWQAQRASRQEKSLKLLRDRLKTTREDTVVAHALQAILTRPPAISSRTIPKEAIVSIRKRLADTEQTAAAQQSLNQASDMQEDQLADIRRRQKELREKVGVIAEQRRVMEPVFAEIRDRQRQFERSLGELETDDHKNGVAVRLKELDQDVPASLAG